MSGLDLWRAWLRDEGLADLPPGAAATVQGCVRRLAGRAMDQVIWGDCNPKNVILYGDRPRLIDFQLRRSSIMLDLVLLFSFADAPETYLPRKQAHGVLPAYLAGDAEQGRAWFDDELLWRLLVYGGNLLRRRHARSPQWSAICRKMAPDLCDLLSTAGVPSPAS